jgi:hypothetical protein
LNDLSAMDECARVRLLKKIGGSFMPSLVIVKTKNTESSHEIQDGRLHTPIVDRPVSGRRTKKNALIS